MRVENTTAEASLSFLSANALVGTVAEPDELPDFTGRTLSTFDTRQMRHHHVPSDLSDDSDSPFSDVSTSDLGSDGDSSVPSNESARFAVIVPLPEEALSGSDSGSDSMEQPSNTNADNLPTQDSKGRVMAVLADTLNFFRPRSNANLAAELAPDRRQSLPCAQPQSGQPANANPLSNSIRSLDAAGEALIQRQLTLDPNYLKRTTEGAKRIEYDECVDICFMPNRTGTRGPSAPMSAKANEPIDIVKLLVPSADAAAHETGRAAGLMNDSEKAPALCHQMRFAPVNTDGKIEGCFMCHPDAGQIVVMDREFRVRDAAQSAHNADTGVMLTLNKKPYTDKEHILVFPTKHMPQAYNSDLFTYSLNLLAAAHTGNKLIDDHADHQENHNYTVLFAGPVGGSQSHYHQHLINKKTNLQGYLEGHPEAVKRIVFAENPQHGVFRITSEALPTLAGDAPFIDPKRGELKFFDCLMVKGDAAYVERHTTKIIDHLNEQQADGTVRARYNMAILPIDDDGNFRSIIFPRSTEPGTDHVKRPILWGKNTFPPSAHEMCGHWFMSKLPTNTSDASQEEFDYKVRRAIYKAAHDVRAPIDMLDLDKLYKDEVTLVPSAGVRIDAAHSTPEFPAANWYGWDDLAVDRVPQDATLPQSPPLKSCLVKPDNLRRDTDFIKPEMSQQKVNELYETLDFVAKLFKRFEIPYFGGAGTSLSAVRHGGQMPNDDDADLFLPYDVAPTFESEAVQTFIASQGYRVDTYSELNPEKGTELVYQIRKNDGRDIKDVPFVDIAFMQSGTLEDKPVWEFSVGRKDGSRSFYRLPQEGFKPENMREIYFGRRLDDEGQVAFKGVPIMVPKEENVLFHLDGAYGKNWYQTNFVPNVGPLYISDRGHIPYKGDKLN
jgi:hypothetical protein